MTPLWKSLPVRWSSWRKFASRSNGSADLDLELARSWLKDLHPNTIPRHIAQLSFSRSSGPGGQNVNKSVQPRDPLLLLPPLLVTCSLLPVLRAPSSVRCTCTSWNLLIVGFLQGQFKGHAENPIGGLASIGAKFVTPPATRFPLCDRPVPGPGDTIRRIPTAIE
jgi:hypothetical protein